MLQDFSSQTADFTHVLCAQSRTEMKERAFPLGDHSLYLSGAEALVQIVYVLFVFAREHNASESWQLPHEQCVYAHDCRGLVLFFELPPELLILRRGKQAVRSGGVRDLVNLCSLWHPFCL